MSKSLKPKSSKVTQKTFLQDSNERSPSMPPSTRYQGSKFKLLNWIGDNLRTLSFTTVLDAFGGTASVSYLLKSMGKNVTYNDYLHFNQTIGLALIENSNVLLSDEDVQFVLSKHGDREYDDFIFRTFEGIYFTTSENKWLGRGLPKHSALAKSLQTSISIPSRCFRVA